MPRVSGVSGSCATRPIRLSPSPIRVSRWSWRRRIGLPVCSTLIIVLLISVSSTPLTNQISVGGLLAFAEVAAARLQRRYLDVAPRRDRARAILALERVEGRPHHVVGVGRAQRLRHHVLHAQRLEHRAHRTAGDDAGTSRRGPEIDLAGAVAAGDVMMQGATLAQRHADEPALGGVRRLADGLRHLARLAVAEPDPALRVADHDEGGEAEAASTLHHLGDAVDVDELVGEFAVALFPFAALAWFTCHIVVPFVVPAHPGRYRFQVQKLSPPSRAASARASTRPW